MTVYSSRFDLAAADKFTHANKLLAWPGATVASDQDTSGNIMSILAAGGPNGEAACRYLYPPGQVGAPGRSYLVSLGHVGVEVKVSWDWLFESAATADNGKDFDLYGNKAQSHNGGKLAPSIQWGPIAGARGGVRAMTWWQTNSINSSPTHPKGHNAVLQWQQTLPIPPNNELITPPVASTTIVPGVWHHHEMILLGGPGGYYRNKIDGLQVCSYSATMGGSLTDDSVDVDMVGFSGGGSAAADSPLWDSWARIANVVITIADDVVIPPIEESIRSARVLLA